MNNTNNNKGGNNNFNILFYSIKCKFCHSMVNLLLLNKLDSYFKMICVDNNMQSIPKHINKVPAILIYHTNEIYMGSDAFKWVDKMVAFKNGTSIGNNTLINDNVVNYDVVESSSITNSFSYINSDLNNNDDLKKGNDKNVYSAFNTKPINTTTLYTPPIDDKLTRKEQSEKIKLLSHNRHTQTKEIINGIQVEQQKILNKLQN